MKKLLVLVGAVALVGSTFAQKPSADDSKFSLEGGLNYNAGDGIQWSAPTIRFRYFVNDNIAGRLQLGLGDGMGTPSSESFTFAENTDGTGATGTDNISRSSWTLQLGGEYHLAGTDRLSPYFMLGINVGGGSYTREWANFNGLGYSENYISREINAGVFRFGVNIGAGMDYYIFENVYLGLELGLGWMSQTIKDGTDVSVVNVGGQNVTTTEKSLASKSTVIGTNAMNASFRLGWRF
jgi:opacity protein-like surface antigen